MPASFSGPSMTSTTSLSSIRRKTLLSLTARFSVMTVSLMTLLQIRVKRSKASREMPLPSSAICEKRLGRSSAGNDPPSPSVASASASFARPLKKLVNLAPSMGPLPPASSAKRASVFRPLLAWWRLRALRACVRTASSSCDASFFASPRNRLSQAEALVMRWSRVVVLMSSFFASVRRKRFSSAATSLSRSPWIASLVAVSFSLATLIRPSMEAACLSMASDLALLSFAGMRPSCSWSATLLTDSDRASTSSETPATIFSRSAFRPLSSSSLARRFTRRSASRSFSRAMPTAILTRWKSSDITPLAPASTKTSKIRSRVSAGTTKEYSPLAYPAISLRLRAPSLSESYFLKIVSRCS
mmetsp:Transcript_80014/g.180510  ORF Transcript_80014/g.180510 Transcript_80014/m.180510 type:complete len:358 (+) Transcript_80014:440-1513(+)